LEHINPNENNNTMEQQPKDLLISKIEEYINNYKKTIETPQLIEELNALKKENEYYHDAMKGIISIDQLREEDIDLIPKDSKRFWKDIRHIAVLNKLVPDDGKIKIEREQRKIISSFYHKLNVETSDRIAFLESQIASKHDDITYGTIEMYEKVKDKIENDVALDNQDYECISTMLEDIENIDISDNELYSLYVYIGRYMLSEHNLVNVKNIPDDDEVSEIVMENENEIDDQTLIDLFNKYGYKYNLANAEKKTLIKKFGNIEKITNIFDTLKKYIIDDDYINNLIIILVYSSVEIINNIFKNIENDQTENITGDMLFSSYMANPNLFISGRKVDRQKSGDGKFNDIEGEAGLYNNYLANRKFFIEQGFDITKSLKSCISVFGTKNQTLVDTYAKFMSYDISKKVIESNLSCLSTKDVYKMMDLLIENECEPHLRNYLAQSVKFPKIIIRRIIVAKMKGLPYMNEDYTFPSYISQLRNEKLSTGIEDISKYIDETEYFDTESLLQEKEIYDNQVIDTIYVRDKKLEENKYINYLDSNFMDSNLSNVYNIGEVLISRRKVLRVYGELIKKHDWENNKNLLMYAITYNSILSREQLETIENTVDYIISKTKELS